MTHPTPPVGDTPPIAFDSLGLHADLLRGIHDLGFLHPTPVQREAIPHILAGRDLIGCAQTGTGKTAAFVLPILHRLMQSTRHHQHPRALVISPTRELALQSIEELKSLSRYVHLRGAAIFGGVPIEPQKAALRRGIDIISATPGRLLDHIYQGMIDFVDIEVLVLDEADRMLDMGFQPDIQKILSFLPAKRQTLLLSATMPPEILKLANQILHQPVTVQIGQRSAPAAGIRHALYPVPHHLKTDLLIQLLRASSMPSVLVFTRTKHRADRLFNGLERAGFRISILHGDRSQSQRLTALERFRQGKTQVMVATDIAARGIDIDDISHVINFDVPNSAEDYVHRIGRTARAEATGDAFTLMAPDEEPVISDIEQAIHQRLPRVTLPTFDYRKPAPPRTGGSSHGRPQGRPFHGQSSARPHGASDHGRRQGGGGHASGRPPHHRPS